MNRGERGMALITALLVGAVLMVLVLAVGETARRQVAGASRLMDRAVAGLAVRSAMAEVVQRLNTRPATALMDPEGEGAVRAPPEREPGDELPWNLHGAPFTLAPGVTVTLQDAAGLIPLTPPDLGLLRALLVHHKVRGERIETFLDSLQDWIDPDDLHHLHGAEAKEYLAAGLPPPRNGYLQTMNELARVMGMDAALYQVLRPDLTYYSSGHFNPMTASPTLLAALVGEEVAREVVALRDTGTLKSYEMSAMTGLWESETVTYGAGTRILVTIAAQVGEARAVRHVTVIRKITSHRPYGMSDAW